MNTLKRKLAVILSADVVGYSRLMTDDEEATVHTRLRIGVGVMNPYTRHPVVMAQMASTLQHFCGGRMTLSIGSGVGWVLDKAGIIQHASAVEECITSVRSMIAGQRTGINGHTFRINGVRIRIIPPKNDVPIYLAAVSPDSWETAMRVADGVATFWNEGMVNTRQKVMADNSLPTVALVPFTSDIWDAFF